MRVVAYTRVSTIKQADGGISLEAQRAKAQAYAALYDLHVVEIIEDAGFSGKSLRRPGIERALAMLEAGEAEGLLVVGLDRLTRSVADLATLIRDHFASRHTLFAVNDQIDTRTAGGRLVLNVLGSVAQWERERIGERVSAVMQHKASKGEFTGGRIPYGYRLAPNGRTLEADPAEQEVIDAAQEARARGLSLRAAAAELARKGFRSRTGRTFAPTQIRRMVA